MRDALNARAVLPVLGLMLLVPALLSAADARIGGTVKDTSGGPIAKATIRMDDAKGGYSYEFESNKKGKFFRRGLSPRKYTLTVEKEGYLPHIIEDVVVQLGVERHFDVVLKTPEDRSRESRQEQGGAAYAGGAEAFERADFDEAAVQMAARVAEDPTDLRARLILAESLYQLGRHAEAATHYEAALALEPERGDVYQRLGQCYLRLGEQDKARATLQKAEELSDDPAVSYNIGALLLKEDKTDAAQAAFERALSRQPGYPPALNGLGRIHLEKQEFAQAREKLAAYLEAEPEAPDAAEVKILLKELERLTQ